MSTATIKNISSGKISVRIFYYFCWKIMPRNTLYLAETASYSTIFFWIKNFLVFLSDKQGFSEKLPLPAYKVGLSKKLTLSDQIIWVSLR